MSSFEDTGLVKVGFVTDDDGATLTRVWGNFSIGASYEGAYHLRYGEFSGLLGGLHGSAFVEDVVDG